LERGEAVAPNGRVKRAAANMVRVLNTGSRQFEREQTELVDACVAVADDLRSRQNR